MWFEVIGDKYDWFVPGARTMICYPSGQPHFGTRACVTSGVAAGKIKKIRKPAGWTVGKDGKAVKNA